MRSSKLLDPDMSPLGFDADQMYQFVSVRFHSSAPRVQEQALTWLQVCTRLIRGRVNERRVNPGAWSAAVTDIGNERKVNMVVFRKCEWFSLPACAGMNHSQVRMKLKLEIKVS